VLWVTHYLSPGPLGAPGEGHAPFRVAMAFETGGTAGYQDKLDVAEPRGYSDWARGMWAKRTGQYEEAERSLRAAVQEMPKNADLLVDLGNVQFLRGQHREAKASYTAALDKNSRLAAAHYNLSQVLTEELDLLGADASIQTALALDPGRISDFSEGPAKSLRRGAIDRLPGVAPFWWATLFGRGMTESIPLPAGLRLLSPGGRIGLMPLGLIIIAVLGFLAGQWLKRSVKTHSCRSCGTIVCRRCLIRVEGEPYCLDCGNTLSADCSTEYSKALLERYFRKRYTPRSVLARVVRWLLPGWAEASSWPVARSMVVLSFTGCALLTVSLPGPPVSPDPAETALRLPGLIVWTLAFVLYGMAHLAAWRWRGEDDTRFDEDEDVRRAAS
jgi:tetratricopeptide (TPR) repeat protein